MAEPLQLEIIEERGEFYYRHPDLGSRLGPWPSMEAMMRQAVVEPMAPIIAPAGETWTDSEAHAEAERLI